MGRGPSPPRAGSLPHSQQLEFVDEHGARRHHAADPLLAEPELGRDGQLALAAHLHPDEPLVPPLDGIAGAEAEGERVLAVAAGVELRAVLQPAGVVDLDDPAELGLVPLAELEIHVADSRRGDVLPRRRGSGGLLVLHGQGGRQGRPGGPPKRRKDARKGRLRVHGSISLKESTASVPVWRPRLYVNPPAGPPSPPSPRPPPG